MIHTPSIHKDVLMEKERGKEADSLDRRRIIAITLGFFVLVLALEQVEDKTGISSVLSRLSQDVFYRVVGSDKTADYFYSRNAQDKVTAVVINDTDDLPVLNATWPVSYAIHADVLQTIAEKKPMAIYVDILFADAREDSSVHFLSKVICEIVDSGIPVYLASADPFAKGMGVREELRKCASIVSAKTPVNMDDGVLRSYDLSLHDAGKVIPSAALALYAEYKQGDGQASFSADQFEESMQIFWGKQTAPLNRKWMTCNDPSMWASFFGSYDDSRSSCPYTPTLAVRHLLGEGKVVDEDIRYTLEGKLVIYGASITGAGDVVRTPAHYDLPGLYGHAMALDNLLTFDAKYKREASFWLDVFVQLALLGVYGLLWLSNSGKARTEWSRSNFPRDKLTDLLKWPQSFKSLKESDRTKAFKVICRLLALPIFIVISVLVMFYCLNFAPQSWLKFLMVVVTAAGLKGLIERMDRVQKFLGFCKK